MKLAHDSKKPLYGQIVDVVMADIRDGRLKPGDKLPSEADFSERYNVSRVTVRRALEELKSADIVTPYQGKGYFVSVPVFERPLTQTKELLSFTQMCLASGREPGGRLIKVDYVNGTDRDNEFLCQKPGSKLLRVQRVRTADGVPIFLENSLFPGEGFEFLTNGSLDGRSMNSALADELGRNVASYSRCTIRACCATPRIAELLSIPVGDPLFLEMKDLVDENGAPMLIAKDYLVGNFFVFDM